jgi:flagellar biosynthesis protein FliP
MNSLPPALSNPIQILFLLTALAVLPALFMTVTPFLRIITVLHFLRQALGTQTAPSNQVLVGLALLLTLAVMRPVVDEIHTNAYVAYEQGKLTGEQALDRASEPLARFLRRFVREPDVALMLEISHTPPARSPEQLGLAVLMPAYVLSELKTSFQIGAVLFLPFLVIDLVVASVTLTVGMVQLPPVMLSAPLKILLFVMVDGWNLVIGSLVRSFQ